MRWSATIRGLLGRIGLLLRGVCLLLPANVGVGRMLIILHIVRSCHLLLVWCLTMRGRRGLRIVGCACSTTTTYMRRLLGMGRGAWSGHPTRFAR